MSPVRELPAPPAGLVVTTRLVPDPGPLLHLLPEAQVYAWVSGGEGLVGWGTAARCQTAGPDRFRAADAWWRATAAKAAVDDEVASPGSGLVAFGSFAFADDSAIPSRLVVPALTVGHRGGRWWVTTATQAAASPPAELRPQPRPRPPGDVTYATGSLTAARWQEAVSSAVDRLAAGAVDKVVLARDVRARLTQPIDPRWLLGRLAELYPSTWTFAVDGLVGATPELLVRLVRGRVSSRVLAGTSTRTDSSADDALGSAALAHSRKDLDEHAFAVRSVADSLAPWCGSLTVPASPFVLQLPNVLHLASDVSGSLTRPASCLRLLDALHPTAAVCGTPTAQAGALIAELEGMDRGRYAGPVGWLDARGDGEWGLALRCGQIDADDPALLRLYAGCGIVAGSDPAAELAESVAKLRPMREALSPPRVRAGGVTLRAPGLPRDEVAGDSRGGHHARPAPRRR